MNDLRLVKSKVEKNNKEYYDFVLCWTYEGKKYSCRVDATFKEGYRLLLAMSESVSKDELKTLR